MTSRVTKSGRASITTRKSQTAKIGKALGKPIRNARRKKSLKIEGERKQRKGRCDQGSKGRGWSTAEDIEIKAGKAEHPKTKVKREIRNKRQSDTTPLAFNFIESPVPFSANEG